MTINIALNRIRLGEYPREVHSRAVHNLLCGGARPDFILLKVMTQVLEYEIVENVAFEIYRYWISHFFIIWI